MLAVLDKNPLQELYEVLRDSFKWAQQLHTKYKYNVFSDDDRAKCSGGVMAEEGYDMQRLLENNGCTFKSDAIFFKRELGMTQNYILIFIYGANGNDQNEYFDFLDYCGMRYMFVFMDYFKNMLFGDPDPVLDNSKYFDALFKIVNIFIQTSVYVNYKSDELIATALASNYRFAPMFITAQILTDTVGYLEHDSEMIEYEAMKKLLSEVGINLLLTGIRTNE